MDPWIRLPFSSIHTTLYRQVKGVEVLLLTMSHIWARSVFETTQFDSYNARGRSKIGKIWQGTEYYQACQEQEIVLNVLVSNLILEIYLEYYVSESVWLSENFKRSGFLSWLPRHSDLMMLI